MTRLTRISLVALAAILVMGGITERADAYGLCGQDWTYKSSPMGENYVINPNCVDSAAGSSSDQIAYLNNGFDAWNNAEACFSFNYGGTNGGTSVTYNSVNLVHFDTTPPDGGGYVAATYYWPSGGDILECDLVFNDQSYTWNGVGTCGGGEMDIWNVGTHEAGHFLCLADLYNGADSTKTMYGYVSNGETQKRTLHSDDINGIQAIYGYCGGSPCTDDGYEDNDAFGSASTISAGTINGLYICSNDDDYYRFYVEAGSSIQVDNLHTYADGNLNLYLYDPNQFLLDSGLTYNNNESVSEASAAMTGYYYARVTGLGGDENSYNQTLTITAGPTQTVSVVIGCVPGSGTLPYVVSLWPQLCNDYTSTRTIHGRINVTIASGTNYNNWKSGATNVSSGNCYVTSFNVNLPNYASLRGTNTFSLVGTDITAPPYNQPPYAPSGDTAMDACTSVGN